MAGREAIKQIDHAGSPERFGYSWAIWNEILPEHQEQFRRWSSALPRELWRGARFIDVGCGMGRNSHWAMLESAAGGVAIDIDERSLAAARRNLAKHPVEVRKQSAYEIAEVEAFDIAFSIGVIHHLAEPERALERMVRALRPGGHILIWVYGAENNTWLVRLFDPIRRHLFSRLPLSIVHHLSLYPTALLCLCLRLGLYPNAYFRLLRRMPFGQLRVIVFDQMIPRIAHYWPRRTVEELMHRTGLEEICIQPVNDVSWSASGRKPSSSK